MESIQAKFSKADAICRETRSMLRMQEDYFNDRTPVNLNTLKIQTNKVRDMLDIYYGTTVRRDLEI